MARVDRFGRHSQVPRESRGEGPIDCLPESDPKREGRRSSISPFDLANSSPLHADPITELFLCKTNPPSRRAEVRAERERDATRFPVAVELVIRSPSPHKRMVAAASLPRLTSRRQACRSRCCSHQQNAG